MLFKKKFFVTKELDGVWRQQYHFDFQNWFLFKPFSQMYPGFLRL